MRIVPAAVRIAGKELIFVPIAVRRVRIVPSRRLREIAGNDVNLAVWTQADAVRAVFASAFDLLEQRYFVELVVASTEPGVKGDTASGGGSKVATLETGITARVPLFIKEGETVRVDTRTGEVAGRA